MNPASSRPRILASMLCALAFASPVHAQLANHIVLGGGGSSTRLQTIASGVPATLSGITAFGAGRIGSGLLGLEVTYRQGSLTPDTGAGQKQDVVDGRVLAIVKPLSWLQVAAGPHLRAYIVPGLTERWVLIEARVRAEGSVAPTVRTHIEIWTALSAKVNTGSGGAARGGEAGITIRLPRSPVWGRLTYAIDRAAVSGGGRIETLEDIALSVGFGRP